MKNIIFFICFFYSSLIYSCELMVSIKNNGVVLSFSNVRDFDKDKILRKVDIIDYIDEKTFYVKHKNISNSTYNALSINKDGVLIYIPDLVKDKKNCKINYDGKGVVHNDFLLIYRNQDLKSHKEITILSNDIRIDLLYTLIDMIYDVSRFYRDKFGRLINDKITVFITSDGSNEYGHVIGNILHLNFDINNVNFSDLRSLISHEIFHLWNYTQSLNRGDIWMHEGSAEHFSAKYLFSKNYISRDEFIKLISYKVNLCYSSLRNYSINKSSILGNSDISYFCGFSIHFMIENLLGENVLYDIWKKILMMDEYNNEVFVNLVCSYVEKGYCNIFRNLIERDLSPDNFINYLSKFGIKYRLHLLGDNDLYLSTSDYFKDFLMGVVFQNIIENNCNGSYQYNVSKDGIYISDVSKCPSLAGKRITMIAGEKGSSKKLFDKYIKSCNSYGQVRIELDNKESISIKCSYLPDIEYKIYLDLM